MILNMTPMAGYRKWRSEVDYSFTTRVESGHYCYTPTSIQTFLAHTPNNLSSLVLAAPTSSLLYELASLSVTCLESKLASPYTTARNPQRLHTGAWAFGKLSDSHGEGALGCSGTFVAHPLFYPLL